MFLLRFKLKLFYEVTYKRDFIYFVPRGLKYPVLNVEIIVNGSKLG